MRVRSSGIAFAGVLLYVIVFVIAAAIPVTAADTTTQLVSEKSVYVAAAPVITEPSTTRLALAAEGKGPSEPKNICLDFHAADITDVLKALSVQSGANIVTGTDVKGQVTVSLNKVSLSEALDMVTKLSGFKYAEVGAGTYIVGTGAGISGVLDAGSDETVTEALTIKYANPDQLGQVLTAQVPGLKYTPSGAKTDQPGPKVMIVSGTRSVVDNAKAIVTQVEETMARDAENQTVEVYKLKYASAKDAATLLAAVLPQLTVSLGPTTGFEQRPPSGVTFITSSSGGNGGSTGDSSQGVSKEEPTAIVMSGTPEDIAKAKELLSTLDIKPKQVLIETKVTDITIGAQKRLGLTWSWNSITYAENNKGTEVHPVAQGPFDRAPLSISAQLDAMLEDNSAQLLANPTVAAIEGKPAVIFIGDEIKYIIRIDETLTGVNFQTETANVGVTLRVVARPDEDGYITLALHPEVSTISDWLTIGTGTGGNNAKTAIALPQISRRFTDHVIRVKDGETIVIGGLIRDYELSNLTKVPLLGDLPFFGGLFRHREKTKEHSDVAIFLKATVMKD